MSRGKWLVISGAARRSNWKRAAARPHLADAGSRNCGGFIPDFFPARSVAALWHVLARRDAQV